MKLSNVSVVLTLLAVGVAGCGKKEAGGSGGDSADSVATVNGDAISAKEYQDWIERKNQVVVNTQQGPQILPTQGSVGVQALRDLIDRRIIFQIAKEQGVMPTDADVQKELDFRNAQTPGYTTQVTGAGKSLETLKDDVKFDLAREKIVTKGVTVTPAEVAQFIKENAKEFTEPPKVDMLFLVISDEKKKKPIDDELAKGASFQSVAMKYSEDPRIKSDNAEFPIHDLSQMPPQLQDMINKVPPLHVSPWIPSGSSFGRFYVSKKEPAKPIKVTDVMRQAIQRRMAIQRGQLTNNLAQMIQDKLKSASIDVADANLKKPWDAEFNEIKREAAASAAQAGPGGGAPGMAPPSRTPPPGASPSKAPSTTKPSASTGGGAPK